jgi:hypothetical protein
MNKESPNHNSLALLAALSISFLLTAFGKGANNSGMAYLVLIFVPVAITLVSYGLYFLSRIFTKKNNWIITIFGIILLLVFGVRVFFNL